MLQKSFPIVQSRIVFENLYERLMVLKVAYDKHEIPVGFEPTGHYWMKLAAFLTNDGIPFVMVNPMHVNRSKELDDNLQTNNDQKDALVIARLFRVMMPLFLHNPAFKQLQEYYTTRTINLLLKKQSIVVLCGKLLKVSSPVQKENNI